jgi:hypothetical protein
VSALADEIPLEHGQGAKDVEHELAATRRRIDLLLQGAERDAPRLELDDGRQMRQGAAQATQPPEDQGVASSEAESASASPGQNVFCAQQTGG